MPLLAAEADVFPADLFEDGAPTNEERAWWVLHTRPRQEKSLARQLHETHIPFYLPLIHRRWQLRGRMMTSYVPLFAGYVFLHADRDERLAALGTKRVVHSLAVVDQASLWQDLRQIHRLIATGAPITPEDRLVPGMTVEIRSGPLAGLKGTILRTSSGQRFVVQVNFIQRGASVLMDDYNLAKVDEDEGDDSRLA